MQIGVACDTTEEFDRERIEALAGRLRVARTFRNDLLLSAADLMMIEFALGITLEVMRGAGQIAELASAP